MAWNHDDVRPNRSRDELLDDVVRRGERLRRHRRVVGGLGSGIAMLLAVAGVTAVVGPGSEPSTQLAATGPTSTLVQSLQSAATGGTTFALDAPTTTVSPVATTVATTPRATATTVPAASPDPTVTTVPGLTDSTIAAPLQPRCSPAQMQATMTIAPSFRQGAPVVGQAVLRNLSGAPCFYYSTSTIQGFKNDQGTMVSHGSGMVADNFADTPFPATHTLTASPTWDQRMCGVDPSCPLAPPGTYTATVSWSFDGPPIEAVATFQIVP